MGRRNCCEPKGPVCCDYVYGGREPGDPPAFFTIKWDDSVEIVESAIEAFLKEYDITEEYVDVSTLRAMTFNDYLEYIRKVNGDPDYNIPLRNTLTLDWDLAAGQLDFTGVRDHRKESRGNYASYIDTEFALQYLFGGNPGSGKMPDTIRRMSDCRFWNLANASRCFDPDRSPTAGAVCSATGEGGEIYEKENRTGGSGALGPRGINCTWDKVAFPAPDLRVIPMDTIEWETITGPSFTVYQHNIHGKGLFIIRDERDGTNTDPVFGPTVMSKTFTFKFRVQKTFYSKVGGDPTTANSIPYPAYEEGPALWPVPGRLGFGLDYVWDRFPGPYTSSPLGTHFTAKNRFEPANSRLSPDELARAGCTQYQGTSNDGWPYTLLTGGYTVELREEDKHTHQFRGVDEETLEGFHTGTIRHAGVSITRNRFRPLWRDDIYYGTNDEVITKTGPYHQMSGDPNEPYFSAYLNYLDGGRYQWVSDDGFDNLPTYSFRSWNYQSVLSPYRAYKCAQVGIGADDCLTFGAGYPAVTAPIYAYSADGIEMMDQGTYQGYGDAIWEWGQQFVTDGSNITFNDINIARLFRGDSGSVTFPQAVGAGQFTAFDGSPDGLNPAAYNLANGVGQGGPPNQPFYNGAPYGRPTTLRMINTSNPYVGNDPLGFCAVFDEGPLAGRPTLCFNTIFQGGSTGNHFLGFAGFSNSSPRGSHLTTYTRYNPATSTNWAPDEFGGINSIGHNLGNTIPYVDAAEFNAAVQAARDLIHNHKLSTGHFKPSIGGATTPNPYPTASRHPTPVIRTEGTYSRSIINLHSYKDTRQINAGVVPKESGPTHHDTIEAENATEDGSLPPADDTPNPMPYRFPLQGPRVWKTYKGNNTLFPSAGSVDGICSAPPAEIINEDRDAEMTVSASTANYTIKKYTGPEEPNPTIRVFGHGDSTRNRSIEIDNNDDTPSSDDGTDFGTVIAGDESKIHFFVIMNKARDAVGDLNVSSVTIPDGFKKITDDLKNIKCDTEKYLTLELLSDGEPGIKGGTVVLKNNTGTDFTFDIIGQVIGPD